MATNGLARAKLSAGFYLFAVSAVLSVVGSALFLRAVTLSQGKFYSKWNFLVIALVILSVIGGAAATIIAARSRAPRPSIVRDILSWCSTLCLASAIVFILSDTAEEIGVFYFSSLDSSNQAVIAAMNVFVPAMGLIVAALVLSMAGLFFRLTQSEE